MAVKIRLKRMGKVRAPYYRIVVADSRTKRDGRVIEEIGKYHPKEDPSFIEVNSERAQYWLGVGAQPSEPVTAILKVTGDWQLFKNEAAPAPMRVAEPRRDKTEIFNEALKDSHGELATEAVTQRRAPAKKAASASAAPAEAAPAPTPAAPAEPAAETVAEPAPAPAEMVQDDSAPAAATADSASTATVAESGSSDLAPETADAASDEVGAADSVATVDSPGDPVETPSAQSADGTADTSSAESAVAPGADAAPASGETDMATGVAETKAAASGDESTEA